MKLSTLTSAALFGAAVHLLLPATIPPAQAASDTVQTAENAEILLDQYRQAEALRRGKGVPQDEKAAVEMHKALAGQGFVRSIARLGRIYQYGSGAPKDLVLAEQYYRAARDAGDTDSVLSLGQVLLANGKFPEALAAFDQAVALNIDEAKSRRAIAHLDGDFGALSDTALGYAEVQSFAAAGDLRAMKALAGAYQDGRGTDVDLARAFDLYKKIAETGDSRALSAVGDFYASGQGTVQDFDKAIAAYSSAYKAGYERSLLRVAKTQLLAGRFAAARATYEQAVTAGVSGAALTLARADFEGGLQDASDRPAGAASLVRLAEGGDIRAATYALKYQERRETRLDGLDADVVVAHLTAAMEAGNVRATNALLRYYRRVAKRDAGAVAARAMILDRHADQLDPADILAERIFLTYDQKGPVRSRPDVAALVATAGADEAEAALDAARSLDRNMFTYVIQSELAAAGLYAGRPTGLMSSSTLRATMAFCASIGAMDECTHGPLRSGASRKIADGLAALHEQRG